MYCQHCGTKLPDNARFCSECGGKVGLYASNEGTLIVSRELTLTEVGTVTRVFVDGALMTELSSGESQKLILRAGDRMVELRTAVDPGTICRVRIVAGKESTLTFGLTKLAEGGHEILHNISPDF